MRYQPVGRARASIIVRLAAKAATISVLVAPFDPPFGANAPAVVRCYCGLAGCCCRLRFAAFLLWFLVSFWG